MSDDMYNEPVAPESVYGTPESINAGMDLRHLAVILTYGKQAADRMGDAALTTALDAMAEVAASMHLDPNGIFNIEREFAALADRLR